MKAVFIILAIAAATNLNARWPQGEKHAIIVFIKANNATQAAHIATEALKEAKWKLITITKVGVAVADEVNRSGDKEAIAAYKAAFCGQQAIIVFHDPYHEEP